MFELVSVIISGCYVVDWRICICSVCWFVFCDFVFGWQLVVRYTVNLPCDRFVSLFD